FCGRNVSHARRPRTLDRTMRTLRIGGLALVVLCACGGDDSTIPDAAGDGGGQDATTDTGGMDSGGMDSGGMDSGDMDTGGMDSGDMDTGTNESGGNDGGMDGGIMDASPDGPIVVDGGIVCDKVGSPWHYLVD